MIQFITELHYIEAHYFIFSHIKLRHHYKHTQYLSLYKNHVKKEMEFLLNCINYRFYFVSTCHINIKHKNYTSFTY